MMISVRLVFMSLLASLVSCSYMGMPAVKYQKRELHYLEAKSIPPLKFPPRTSSARIASDYPVAEKNHPQSAKTVSIVPPGLTDQP